MIEFNYDFILFNFFLQISPFSIKNTSFFVESKSCVDLIVF